MRRLAGTAIATLGALLIAAFAVSVLYVLRDDPAPRPVAPALTSAADAHEVTDQLIAFYLQRIDRDPADFVSYTKLGAAYLRQARETGDVGAYERAETALRRALELRPEHLDAGAALATVLFATHDFAGALALAERVYAADPGATQALATTGDAHLALGNYEEARWAYGELAGKASGAAIDSRLAHVAYLYGDSQRAIELMERAVEAANARGRTREEIAWYRSQLAELLYGAGRYEDAGRWYEASLEALPGYRVALAGLGAVAAARGDLERAIACYEQAVAAVPEPSYLAALGDVYARTGEQRLARERYETVEFIGRLAPSGRAIYNRELALFLSDHEMDTARAVELARAELGVRRDIYAYDTLAWALYRDGRAAEAAPLMERALELGTKDARLLFHAGMIAQATGDGRAQELLDEALALNPNFSVLLAEEARAALAQLRRGGR
jgi:tetratricopeptide (TPR) repeat protein